MSKLEDNDSDQTIDDEEFRQKLTSRKPEDYEEEDEFENQEGTPLRHHSSTLSSGKKKSKKRHFEEGAMTVIDLNEEDRMNNDLEDRGSSRSVPFENENNNNHHHHHHHNNEGEEGEGEEDEEKGPPPSVLKDGFGVYLKRSLKELFLSSKMNILLIFIPFAFLAEPVPWTDNENTRQGVAFFFALLSLIPLAERLSFVTEDLANYTNDTIGGLMNASMGNVPELIMSIVALTKGALGLRIVQLSLLGSVLSNLLLVLGTAFLLGGARHVTQMYNKPAAISNVSLLTLVILSLCLPTGLSVTDNFEKESDLLGLSRLISFLLLCTYSGLIVYQLKTHPHLFEDEDDEEEEEPILGMGGAVFWMAVMAVLIAILSEIAISSIEAAAHTFNLSTVFISTILLPIVGNAAEHASAIIFAMRNRMEICLGIAVGSSAQVSMFLIPVLVLIAWPLGQPLSLDFQVFEAMTISISIIICSFIIQHGESDWLKGVVLLVAYVIAALGFWYHADIPEALEKTLM